MTDVKPEVIKKTQDTLGQYIKKPVLTEKLLKKPPFRFLHDITTNVIKETDFLQGLFSDTELLSENIKERGAKILFLQKLVDCLKIVTGKNVSARPSKIVAGLEPTKTNELLQVLAYALHKKLDSSAAIQQLQQDSINIKNKSKSEKKSDQKSKEKADKTKSTPRSTKSTDSLASSRKSDDKRESKIQENDKTKSDKLKPSRSKVELKKTKLSSRTEKKDSKTKDISPRTSKSKKELLVTATNVINNESIKIETSSNVDKNQANEIENEIVKDVPEPEVQTLERVEVAEMNTGNDKTGEEKAALNENVQKEHTENEIILEKGPEVMKSKDTPKNDASTRPKTSLRPPSVRVSSARPGAPRLRDRNEVILPPDELIPMGKVNVIVENFTNPEEDNEETVVMETTVLLPEQEPPKQTTDMPAEKGHLVEQILEQLGDNMPEENDHKGRVEVDWYLGNERNRTAANKEMEKLRESIQMLTRTANPLGKLMNFLQEDVDSMRSELKMWIEVNKKFSSEINMMEKINEESIQPLREQLERLDQDITKQREQISTTRGNILRNEQKIKMLLMRES